MQGPGRRARAPIPRGSLHNEVVARLRDMIVEGQLSPGEHIPELELCAEFGVSRTPLREALKVLASEGLVELLPSRGAIVKGLTSEAVHDMLTLMGVLEEHAGQLAVRAPDEVIADILSLHSRLLDCYARRDRRDYFNVNQRLHEAIVRATESEALNAVHATLRQRMRRIRYVGSDGETKWRAALQEHEQIAAALAARKGRLLGRLLRRHLENTWRRVKPTLDQTQG